MNALYMAGLGNGFKLALISTIFFCAPLLACGDSQFLNSPGEVRLDLNEKTLCSIKWGLDKRHVTKAMKAQAFKNYGFTGYSDPKCTPDAKGKTCEIDHLVPRCLAGADTVKNLRPQPYGGPWNAHQKDRLEVLVCKKVCAGELNLEEGQAIFFDDWRLHYLFYYQGEAHEIFNNNF